LVVEIDVGDFDFGWETVGFHRKAMIVGSDLDVPVAKILYRLITTAMTKEVEQVKQVAQSGVPTFGICFGHQLLGRAFGGKTFKLMFGHRGGNQPVKDFQDGHVEITSHNHGFAVLADSLPSEVEVTHVNLNDQCVEGMRHKTLPIISVQYHPEAAPGPHDAAHHFGRFIELMEKRAGH